MRELKHFGPRVGKITLPDELRQKFLDICKPDKDHDHTGFLLGYSREQIEVSHLIRGTELEQALMEYVGEYLLDVDSGHFKDIMAFTDLENIIKLVGGWYNKQVNMEHIPPHTHNNDISCVLYPYIDIDYEAEAYKTMYKEQQQGRIFFRHGETDKNGLGTNVVRELPEEGDLYIFPANLLHWTEPVLGNSVRYSLSCNFNFTPLAHKLYEHYRKELYSE